MTRILLAALIAAAPVAAAAEPAAGRYCAAGRPDIEIGPAPGAIGIDLMDCTGAVYADGAVGSARCFGMGGAATSYDTDLTVQSDGTLIHDGTRYRRQPPGRLCP